MFLELFVFGGDERVAQNLGKIVIAVDHPPLQGKLPDDAVLVVIELGDGGGAIVLQFGDLRKVGGIDQQQASDGAGHGDDQNQ